MECGKDKPTTIIQLCFRIFVNTETSYSSSRPFSFLRWSCRLFWIRSSIEMIFIEKSFWDISFALLYDSWKSTPGVTVKIATASGSKPNPRKSGFSKKCPYEILVNCTEHVYEFLIIRTCKPSKVAGASLLRSRSLTFTIIANLSSPESLRKDSSFSCKSCSNVFLLTFIVHL